MLLCLLVSNVTPFVGVWIETEEHRYVESHLRVTPFVGVWIETALDTINAYDGFVTPFVGVWIETDFVINYEKKYKSHPSWVCGLKHLIGH